MDKLQTLTTELRKLSADLQREEQRRSEIKSSEEYKSIQNEIEALTAKGNALLGCDSSEAYDDVKKELIEEFNKQKLDEFDGVVAVKRESKKVNVEKLLDVISGDVGILLELSGVTQKNLKEFAKLEDNKPIKKSIYSCIEKVGEKITEFKID